MSLSISRRRSPRRAPANPQLTALAALLVGTLPAAASVRLCGRVEPAAAEVTLEPLGSTPAAPRPTAPRIDPHGRFCLTAPRPGLYTLRSAAPGRVPMEVPFLPWVEDTRLPPVTLPLDVGLAVQVIDAAGRPVADARVRSEGATAPPPGAIGWRAAGRQGRTGADGVAHLPGAAGQRLTVRAFHPRLGESVPRLADPAGGPIELRLGPSRRTTVWVVDRRGRTVAGAPVRLGEGRWPAGRSDDEGRLEVAAPAGTLRVEAESAAGDQRGVTRLDPEGGAPLAVTIAPLPPWSGRVLAAAAGRPVPGALVWTEGSDPRTAVAGSDGTFSLPPPPPGSVLRAAAPGFLPAEARPLPPTAEGAPEPLELVLARRGSATGLVTDATGSPVAGATVRLVPDGGTEGRSTTSDPAGTFRFDDLEADRFSLRVTASGFAPQRVDGLGPPPREEEWHLDPIVLEPAAHIAGTVVDGDGIPLPDATVRATPAEGWEQPAASPAIHRAVTGGDGRFEIPDLGPGERLDLEAVAAGRVSARLVAIEAPAEGVTIALPPAATLRGRVIDADGRPIADALVRVASEPPDRRSSDAPAVRYATTDTAGRFALAQLAPGPATVRASAAAHGPSSAVSVELEPDRGCEVELVLTPGLRLTGRVLSASGEPLGGASVEVRGSGGAAAEAAAFHRATTGADGRFAVAGLPAGSVSVGAWHPGYLAAAVRLELSAGDGAVELSLDPGLTVEGQVIDASGAPVPSAHVRLLSVGRTSAAVELTPPPPPEALADAGGAFRLRGVAPGRYRLQAEAPGLARAALADELVVEGSGLTGVVVALDPGGVVSGRLLGLSDGAALARLDVRAVAAGELVVEGSVAADGRYRIAGLAPGRWTVVAADADGTRHAVAAAYLADGGETVLDLDLASDATTPGPARHPPTEPRSRP